MIKPKISKISDSGKKNKVEENLENAIEENKNVSTAPSEELSLLNSLQIFLRFYGIERSHASIRDMADISDGPYNFKDAVSSLENMEFSANVGKLSARKISEGHCPLIVDLKNGKTNAYRLVNSEGDRLSGIIIDKYGNDNHFVVSSSAGWVEAQRGDIIEALREVMLKENENMKRKTYVFFIFNGVFCN